VAFCGPLEIQRGLSRSPRHRRREQTALMGVGLKERKQIGQLEVGTAITGDDTLPARDYGDAVCELAS
jgi:hypothetical protein